MNLNVENISFSYDESETPILRAFNLSLYDGEVLGLAGPSGSGKTTLLRLIAGFLRPKSGRVSLDGQILTGDGILVPPEKRGIGFVFQGGALFPHLTVGKNIKFGLGRLWPAEREERLHAMLDLVGLVGLEKAYPHELSGGQRQRVALARALAPAPKFILLDEPLNGLDVDLKISLRAELKEMLKKSGAGGILVSHDPADLEGICGSATALTEHENRRPASTEFDFLVVD